MTKNPKPTANPRAYMTGCNHLLFSISYRLQPVLLVVDHHDFNGNVIIIQHMRHQQSLHLICIMFALACAEIRRLWENTKVFKASKHFHFEEYQIPFLASISQKMPESWWKNHLVDEEFPSRLCLCLCDFWPSIMQRMGLATPRETLHCIPKTGLFMENIMSFAGGNKHHRFWKDFSKVKMRICQFRSCTAFHGPHPKIDYPWSPDITCLFWTAAFYHRLELDFSTLLEASAFFSKTGRPLAMRSLERSWSCWPTGRPSFFECIHFRWKKMSGNFCPRRFNYVCTVNM